MFKANAILIYLKSKPEFSSWGICHLERINNGIQFFASNINKKIEIKTSGKLFSVRIFHAGLITETLTHHYQSVNPKYLHTLISMLQQSKVA